MTSLQEHKFCHRFLLHNFVNFLEKNPFKKFYGVFNHFLQSYEVTKFSSAWKVSVCGVILIHIFPPSHQNNSKYGHFLRSVEFDVSDDIPAKTWIPPLFSFCIFLLILWKKNLLRNVMTFLIIFSQSYEVPKFWMIRLVLQVITSSSQMNIHNILIVAYV